MRGMKIRVLALVASFFLLIVGSIFAGEARKIRVVASFSVPADWIRQVAGEKAEVLSLVPANADNHAYTPSPSDMRKIREADYVFALSPHFEVWFEALSRNERAQKPNKFIFLGDALIRDGDTCSCGHHHHGHAHADTEADPHFWTDPRLVAEHCIPLIEKSLKADGTAFRKQLADFEIEARKMLADIPPERRQIVTYHNNMTHFAKRFGFSVAGSVLASSSTEAADPSAKSLAKLSKKIREERIPIFSDNTVASRLPASLAKDAGMPPPKVLRVDALDVPGSPADTYIGMLRENLRAIAESCKQP